MDGKEVIIKRLDEIKEGKERKIERFCDVYEIPPGITPLPLKNANQSFAVINICHVEQRPRSQYPGYRILGVFSSNQAAEQHIRELYAEKSSELNVYVIPTHQLVPLCRNYQKQVDIEYTRDIIQDLIKLHDSHVKNKKEDHDANIGEQKTGAAGLSILAKRKKRKLVVADLNSGSENLPATSGVILSNQSIQDQQFAVVVTLYDIRPHAIIEQVQTSLLEPLIAILFVSGTEQECVDYAKYTANRAYPNAVLDVVKMYGWLFPENIDEQEIMQEVYASSRLQSIMDARKRNKQLDKFVEDYKNAPITEINPDPTVIVPTVFPEHDLKLKTVEPSESTE